MDRFVARFVDLLLVGLINTMVVTAVVLGGVLDMDTGSFGYGGSLAAAIVNAVLGTVIGLGYFVVMESSSGRTVGKMITKLRVVGAAGGHPSVEESIKRNIWMAFPLLGVVPAVGGLLASLGQLVAVIAIAVGINSDPVRRRPWTDRLAGTQVLKEG